MRLRDFPIWLGFSLALLVVACAPERLRAAPVATPSVDTADSPSARPNIVLVLFEDMSPRVGAYGDALAHTPNFDRIASEGVIYTSVFTTSGVCAPSRAALATGRHQQSIGAQHMRTHGVMGLAGGGPQDYHSVPPASVKAFPELLRRAGYHTSNDDKTDYQFGEPFTIWDVSGEGADWSSRADGQPFFHMRTLLTTHESFVWPTDMATDNPLAQAVIQRNTAVLAGKIARTDPADVEVPPYLPDTPAVRRDIATHYDNIAFTDRALGALYDRLVAEGLLDETILIVSTDHGDGLPRMKRSLYDSGLHVPMVVRYPDAWRAGAVDDRLISFIDLAPTILSWAGAPRPDWMHGRDFAGADADDPRTYVFAAQDRMDSDLNRRRAVRDSDWKYIRNDLPGDPYFVALAFRDLQPTMQALWAGKAAAKLPAAAGRLFEPLPEHQLYRLADDPHEVENLAGRPETAAVQARLEAALDDWTARVGDMSAQSEAGMIEMMWPGGEQPVTAPVEIQVRAHRTGGLRVTLVSPTPGASIGYRLGDDPPGAWRLFTEPVILPSGKTLEAKAIRYGYRESPVVEVRLGD